MNQTAAKNNKTKSSPTTVLLIVLLAVAALILVYSVINSFGIIGRMSTAAKTDNYSLSKNQIKVLKYQQEQNIYQSLYYNCMYYSYGLRGYYTDYFGDLSAYKNNPSGYASAHMNKYNFDSLAYSQAENLLIYCEGARAAGVSLSKEERSDKDALKNIAYINMETLRSGADSNGQTLSAYIKACMGDGVSKGDVQDVIEMTMLANKYYEQKVEELKNAVTEEDAKKYREDNKSSFYFTKYTSYTLKNTDWKEDAEKVTSVEELKKLIVNKMFDSSYNEKYKSVFTDKGITDADKDQTKKDVLATILHWDSLDEGHGDEGHKEPAFGVKPSEEKTDEDKYKTAGYNLATALNTDIQKELAKVNESGKSYYADPTASSATDAQKWLFDAGRKSGDHTVITTETKSTGKDGKETTTKHCYWYLIAKDEDIMQIDTEKTRKGFYVELTDDTDSSISATDKVKRTGVEKYELVEKAASQDDRVKVFTDVLGASEQSSISKSALSGKEAVEKWFFSDDRKEGDFDKVTVTTGTDTKVTKSYAVLFLGVNEENWLVSAKSSVAGERLQTWYNGMKESCHLTMDYEQAPAAETTGAATTVTGGTSAATEPASETATEAVSEGESVTGTETATEPAESETAA